MRYVPLRFDIWLTLLLAFVISLGTVKIVELFLPGMYEDHVEKNTIPENEVGGPAGEDVFRAQSVADLLSHDTFTVVSPGIKYYDNGSAMYQGRVAEALTLPSGELVMAIINNQNIQRLGEDYFSGDHVLPVGRVVFEDLTADETFMEQIQYRDTVLSRTDFYVDMCGPGGIVSQEDYDQRYTGTVQVITILVCFPFLHSLGAKLGIFPFFFAPRPKEGEPKSEWD